MKHSSLNASQRALLYIMKKNKRIFITEALLVIAATIPITLITLLPAQIASAVFSDNSTALMYNVLLMFLLGGIHGIIWYLADIHYVKKTSPLFYKLNEDTFYYVIDKEYASFIAQSPSKIAQYANEIRENIDKIWTSIHYGYLGFAVQVPLIVLISIKVSWVQALIYILTILLLVISLTRKSLSLNILFDEMYTQDNILKSSVTDSITNFVNVKSFKAELKEARHHKDLRIISEQRMDAAFTSFMKYWLTASKIIRFVMWPLILSSTYLLFANDKINAQQVILSISTLIALTDFIWGLVDRISNTKKEFSKLQNGYEYLANEENMFFKKPVFALQNISRPSFKETLEIKNLNFAYPDRPSELVLKNINLTIHKNEKVGIVGKSGGGKSTLVKLLLGFYDYTEGTVLIDSKPIEKVPLGKLNSYVPQDTSLFEQTVQYNIAYARDDKVTKAEIVAAAKKAHADQFIMKLQDGYKTLVGERGVKLSLGQRQRIAIARAFLKDSDLLILDEATSALDSKTESDIQEALEDLWHNKTVIAIAHRLSTLNNVDRIIVVDDGSIVESGTKAELLQNDGMFAKLWNQQKDGLI